VHGVGIARSSVLIRVPADLAEQVARALREDVGSGDATARLLPVEQQIHARILCRERAVLCGSAWLDETFRQLDTAIRVIWHASDGDLIAPDTVLCELTGRARPILTGERTALNFVQFLSATATTTHSYVEALAGTQCQVLDTRKTIPGFRLAQKYAVRCGGGANHRIGLYDLVLIKENHIAAAGSIAAAVRAARQHAPTLKVEVETENLDEFEQALAARADIIMLDDFNLEQMRAAVALNRDHPHPALLESSGGVSIETVRAIAETGVDYISIGSLTKHVRAIDLSLRVSAAARGG
jgi:nicotinate-nucleotide pyrophosphorylase (carboxylating)